MEMEKMEIESSETEQQQSNTEEMEEQEETDMKEKQVPKKGQKTPLSVPSSESESSQASSSNSPLHQETLPWVEKYRPKDLQELISQQNITTTLMKLIDENKLPHLLFYGPPGTGKTSTCLAIAQRIYGKNYKAMVLELNASDERGIDVVREQIKDFANTRNIFNTGVKLIILDEADAMTSDAQAALRRVIEKYTKTTRFCILCNYLGKIIPAIQSRCTRFRFGPLNADQVFDRLEAVCKFEGVNHTKEGLDAITRLSNGDMRKCLNILQSTYMAYGLINGENVYLCTGKPVPHDIEQILSWMLNDDFEPCVRSISQLQKLKGIALQDIITEIHPYVMKFSFSPKLRMEILQKLAEIEYRLSVGSSEKLNIGALVGCFQIARDEIFKTQNKS